MNMVKKEQDKKSIRVKFLDEHEITGKLRGRMVDWMVEVMSAYKCKEQTFFCAVSIMDQYMSKSLKKLEVNELHEIGITAMWMATKYEEIYPIRLKTMQDKIAHGKSTV